MSELGTYMTTRFTGAQNTQPNAAGYYRARPGANIANQNCFAYAVGKATRIDAHTRAQLMDDYAKEGFFPVPMTSPREVGDAEIYSRPTEPNQIVHAHRVTGATTATSKLGPGEVIDHHINTLQVPRPAGGYEYGTVFMRFRHDQAKFNQTFEKTRSGRIRKRAVTDDPQANKKAKPAAAAKPAPTTKTSKTTKPVAGKK